MIKKYMILWTVCAVFVSCVGKKPATSVTEQNLPLTDVRWELSALNHDAIIPPPSGKHPFIRFSGEDNRINGHSGCNGFFGTYTVESNRLSFGPLGMTHMACEDVMDLEMQFMQALAKTEEFKLSGNSLIFFSFGKPVAQFVGSDIKE